MTKFSIFKKRGQHRKTRTTIVIIILDSRLPHECRKSTTRISSNCGGAKPDCKPQFNEMFEKALIWQDKHGNQGNKGKEKSVA